MLLSFNEQFIPHIQSGRKQYTIREDKHQRWKPGMKAHMWKGNPRNVTQNPYQFAEAVISTVEPIEIYPSQNKVILLDSEVTKIERLNMLAHHDGFENWEAMKAYFKEDFKGRILVWEEEITFLALEV